MKIPSVVLKAHECETMSHTSKDKHIEGMRERLLREPKEEGGVNFIIRSLINYTACLILLA
jgi:hypothetical protein